MRSLSPCWEAEERTCEYRVVSIQQKYFSLAADVHDVPAQLEASHIIHAIRKTSQQNDLVPSAFQLTQYGFVLRNWRFLLSMDTGWEPGNPLLQCTCAHTH